MGPLEARSITIKTTDGASSANDRPVGIWICVLWRTPELSRSSTWFTQRMGSRSFVFHQSPKFGEKLAVTQGSGFDREAKEGEQQKGDGTMLNANSVSSREGEIKQGDFRIRKVIQVLKEDPSRTLPELAHGCQISMSRLSHLFKREVGTNVKIYRLECRLEVAAALLLSTDTPIKEIAYSAGYHHPSSFVRAFKTRFGSSPACYRIEHARKWE
jgi:AraC-like DNA-binding protein